MWAQIVLSCFICTAMAADDGDDFSNNLFTDLGPLLALFGERVTAQFLSQSTCWADHIILAMAPLGIMTVIVSAIRVAGPGWLRTIIGRAVESRAAVESELMSSTSDEVCELWNGQQVVRVLGQGQIREFIIVYKEAKDDPTTKRDAQVKLLPLKEGTDYLRPSEYSESFPRCPRPFHTTNASGRDIENGEDAGPGDTTNQGAVAHSTRSALTNSPGNASGGLKSLRHRLMVTTTADVASRIEKGETSADPNPQRIVPDDTRARPAGPVVVSTEQQKGLSAILRNEDDDAPNITLNMHSLVTGRELGAIAFGGTVIQLGVLVYSGMATYHPALMFPKNGSQVSSYAFPCMAIGTILIVFGLLLCAHIIERSTVERSFHPRSGYEARVVWLQRAARVNDQSFESFAMFPTNPIRTLMTSKRRPRSEGEEDYFPISTGLATVLGVLISLAGFIVQFVGLRAMHWSASVAQLVATLVMACLRALVRRGFAQLPRSKPLTFGHELDWLAIWLATRSSSAPWVSRETSSSEIPWSWTIPGLVKPDRVGEEAGEQGPEHVGNRSQEPSPGNRSQEQLSSNKSPSAPRWQNIVTIRKGLGRLAHWQTAGPEAGSLARAIEATLNILRRNGALPWGMDDLVWALPPVCLLDGADRIPNGQICLRLDGWSADSSRSWKVDAEEIEAFLSLWLYSIANKKKAPKSNVFGKPKPLGQMRGPVSDHIIHIVGENTSTLQQELKWWIPRAGGADTLGLVRPGAGNREPNQVLGFLDDTTVFREDADPIWGERGIDSDLEDKRWLWAFEMRDRPPLAELAFQLYSHFMWAIAKKMTRPISGGVTIHPAQSPPKSSVFSDGSWAKFTLSNVGISQLVRDIQATGLGLEQEIYFALVPPLSRHGMLPDHQEIVSLASSQARRHELAGRWREAAESYSWLFSVAYALDLPTVTVYGTYLGPEELVLGTILSQATALIFSYLRATSAMWEVLKDQWYDPKVELGLLKNAQEMLINQLEVAVGNGEIIEYARWHVPAQPAPSRARMQAQRGAIVYTLGRRLERVFAERDATLDCSFERPVKVVKSLRGSLISTEYLNSYSTNLGRQHRRRDGDEDNYEDDDDDSDQEFSGYVRGEDLDVDRHLMGRKGLLGYSRLHRRAIRLMQSTPRDGIGWGMKQYHMERIVDTQDVRGQTALHYFCQAGPQRNQTLLAKSLLQGRANVNIQDNQGLSPLHHAAIHGFNDLTRLICDWGADITQTDSLGNTFLHWAAYHNHICVLTEHQTPSTIMARNLYRRSQLHLVSLGSHNREKKAKTVDTLLRQGANRSDKDKLGQLPLHYATQCGHLEVIRRLLSTAGLDGAVARDVSMTALVKNNNGMTPLHQAACSGLDESVATLLDAADRESQLHALSGAGTTPLQEAAKQGHESTVRTFLACGAKDDQPGQTPEGESTGTGALHVAMLQGHLGIVEILYLTSTHPPERFLSPMHYAARNNLVEALKLLYHHRPSEISKPRGNINFKEPNFRPSSTWDANSIGYLDGSGNRVIHEAVLYRNLDIVRYLAEEISEVKDNLNIRTNDGKTLLHLAVAAPPSAELFQYLVKQGADPDVRDNTGRTLMHDLSDQIHGKESWGRNGLIMASDILLRDNANINIRDSEGRTALHFAVSSLGRIDLSLSVSDRSRLVVRYGCWTTGSRRSPPQAFQFAYPIMVNDVQGIKQRVASKYLMPVEYLVSRGAALDVQDNDGQTPLHYLVLHGGEGSYQVRKAGIGFLVSKGCRKDLKDKEGKTVYQYAKEIFPEDSKADLVELLRPDDEIDQGTGVARNNLPVMT